MGWKTKISRKKVKATLQIAVTVAFIACLNGFIEYAKVLPEDGRVVFYGKPLEIEVAQASESPESTQNDSATALDEVPKENTQHWDENSLQGKIEAIFGNDAPEAIKIAQCESNWNVREVGDEALAFEHNGQTYGRSIGLLQVRTGGIERSGKIWVRSNNVAEFEERMMNPDENIKEAFKIFNSQGWYGWYNCAVLTGVVEK